MWAVPQIDLHLTVKILMLHPGGQLEGGWDGRGGEGEGAPSVSPKDQLWCPPAPASEPSISGFPLKHPQGRWSFLRKTHFPQFLWVEENQRSEKSVGEQGRQGQQLV